MTASNDNHATAPKQGFWEGTRTLVYAIGLALLFRSFLFEPFHIPSGSMLSTLEVGDYIFVSKYSYGYSRYSFPLGLPLFSDRVLSSEPERGDVAVFRLPTNPKVDYIKRVIGLPGDVIRVTDGVLHINGVAVELEQIEDYAFIDETGVQRRVHRFTETLPNGVKHVVLNTTNFADMDNTNDYVVPEGHYFMMGDNRDNSIDSRYQGQVGFVPRENLIGRAEIILLSLNKEAEMDFWEVWKFPELLRGNRFFLSLRND